ncbi:hypothetical protein [uncultured Kordia sp.]|uniref:hypothetical protein n=1 Tax=uncultured Kordia sp. TaxID=507699 RepID=UPI002612706C|nr:hypothetical protein [uncultured Kordia sp.]
MTPANIFFNKLKGTWQNKLNGKWVDNWGWNIISQPNFGRPVAADFTLRFDQMRETIVFKKLGVARNIGISGEEGFWDGMSYEITIRNPAIKDPDGHKDGKAIHQEMGHFLIRVISEKEPLAKLPPEESGNGEKAQIIRQAAIPRANSFMTHGMLFIDSVSNALNSKFEDIDFFYSPKVVSNDKTLQKEINKQFKSVQGKVTRRKGPNLQKMVTFLNDTSIKDLGEKSEDPLDWVFSFRQDNTPTQMSSGQRVPNPVSIGNLLSDFWIGDRGEGSEKKEILQYSQKVNIGFNQIDWPHVAINTLIKQS